MQTGKLEKTADLLKENNNQLDIQNYLGLLARKEYKTAPDESWIKVLLSICCSNDYHASILLKSIYLQIWN